MENDNDNQSHNEASVDGAQTDKWKGDEVADAPGRDAEAAADRAAARTGGASGQTDGASDVRRINRIDRKTSPEEDKENEEEKRQAAVEEHARDKAEGTGTAPKNL